MTNETGNHAPIPVSTAGPSTMSVLAVSGSLGRRAALLIVGLALLAAYLQSAAHSAAQTGTPLPAAQTLHFDVQFADTWVLQDTEAGLMLGDRIILSDRLLRNGQEVGHNAGVCTVTDVAGEMLCTVNYALADGSIATQFLNTAPPEKVFAITGGTGRYQNARGFGELVEHGDETGTITFHLAD